MQIFDKIIIVAILITSLIPSMFLGAGNSRYIPFFIILFISCIHVLISIKRNKNIDRLRNYYVKNKYILSVVLLYIFVIWVASLNTGIKDNLILISGVSFVLVAVHFFIPVIINKKEAMN